MREAVPATGSPCQLLAFAAEFPTGVPINEALLRMAAENWVYHHPGKLSLEEEADITRAFLELFAPMRNGEWVRQATDIGLEVVASARRFLERV